MFKIRTCSTLVVCHRNKARDIINNFNKAGSLEIAQLLSVTPYDFVYSNLTQFVDPYVISTARMYKSNTEVKTGYLIKHLRKIPSFTNAILQLGNNYRIILEVEAPKSPDDDKKIRDQNKYEVLHIKSKRKTYSNIDIGLTSNGKLQKGESLINCAIRETQEEAHLDIQHVMDESYQCAMRRKLSNSTGAQFWRTPKNREQWRRPLRQIDTNTYSNSWHWRNRNVRQSDRQWRCNLNGQSRNYSNRYSDNQQQQLIQQLPTTVIYKNHTMIFIIIM